MHRDIQSEPPYIELTSSYIYSVLGTIHAPPLDTCIECNVQVSRCIERCIEAVYRRKVYRESVSKGDKGEIQCPVYELRRAYQERSLLFGL